MANSPRQVGFVCVNPTAESPPSIVSHRFIQKIRLSWWGRNWRGLLVENIGVGAERPTHILGQEPMLKFVRGLPSSEQNWHLRVQAVAHEKRGLDRSEEHTSE